MMHLYEKPKEETILCNICNDEIKGADHALYMHKEEAHNKTRLIKCNKCGIETNNTPLWLTFHECPQGAETIPPKETTETKTTG